MKLNEDPLSMALESLRNRPVVSESREYAQRWEHETSRTRVARNVALKCIGALAAVCVSAYFLHTHAANLIQTKIGESRTVALEDGSRIVVDASSRVRIRFTATARDVELLQGQAYFEVAKDRDRPFRVRTSFAEVLAVGTSFDVAAHSTRTTVTLIEGRVNVRPVADTAAAASTEVLTPGQQLDVASDGQFLNRKSVTSSNVTAWQRGTIVLDDMPLQDALAELNRYSKTQIVIADPRLQSRRVSGVFRIGDVETEALTLQRYFRLRELSRSEESIVLTGTAAERDLTPRR
jgi:transmembrane sensor